MASPVRRYEGPDSLGLPPIPIADEEVEVVVNAETGERLSFGDVVADRVTRQIGSWRFIGSYFALLVIWIGVNTVAWMSHWDPYPFIFLNLVLSFQGAFAAPIILMSQNRQEARDRIEEQHDHEINLRAEREVAALQARLETLGNASLEAVTALREEQRAIVVRLDALLATMEQRSVLHPEPISTESDATTALTW